MIDLSADFAAALAPLLAELRALRSDVTALRREQTPNLVTVHRAAELTGKHPTTIRRWEREGQIKSVRRGRSVLLDMSTLQPESELERVAKLSREARR